MKDRGKSSQKKITGPVKSPKAGQCAPTQIEARFKAVFEHSRDAIGVSKAGVHVFVNPAYRELFGFHPDADLAGKPVLDLIAPESRDQIKAYILRRIHGESVPSAYETRGLRADGSAFDMEVNVSSYEENGEDHTLVILRDITHRKMAEEEIAERGALMHQIMDTASVAIFLVDRSGRIVHANKRMAEMLGSPLEEILGSEYVDHVHPSERENGRTTMLALLASTIASVDLERLYWRKDGTQFWGHLSGRRFHDVQGNELGLIGVIADIDKSKQAELSLTQREEKYRRLYNETPILLHSIDRDARIVDVNDYWLKTMGYERSEVIGRKVTDFYTEASRKYAQEVTQPAFFRDGIAMDIPYQLVKKNGDILDILLSATAERDAAGTVVRSQAVIEDVTERNRAETALRESEERFKAITTTASDAILLMDDRGKIVYWNPAAVRMFGHAADEAVGKDLHLFLGPERLHDNFKKGFGNFVKTGQGPVINKSVELTAHRRDGTEFPIEVSTSAMNIGGRWHALGIIRDFSDRKRAEMEIQEKERKYEVLFESANDGIFIQDASGFVDCNNRGAEMYGLPKEKLIGRSPAEFAPLRQPNGRLSSDVAGEKVAAALSGAPQVFEWQPQRADGTPFDVEVTLSRLELDGSPYLQSIVRDISERKKAEHALRSSEARFRSIIEHASTGILVADRETRQIVYANPEICRMLGYSEVEFHSLKATDLAIPEEASQSAAGFQFHAAGELQTTERTISRKDGSPVRMNISSVHIEYDGRPSMVGFLNDISEKRLLEDERLKTQKLESIGTLAGGIAHDFNNLLQGVFGFISMAKLTYNQKEKSLAMLEQAEKALHQSVNLTSQLLTFSKGGKPVKKVASLRPVIENAARFALSGSRNEATITIADDLLSVEIDEGQIGQVIQNIVLNADQAMPLGGRIAITGRNISSSPTTARNLQLTGDCIEIVIQDQGTGIPAEHLTRIFDPYFTTKEKGSGLGLATSYSIIRNHDGLITVSSEMGKGTTFTITLPASAVAAAQEQTLTDVPSGNQGRILVMDDEQVVRDVTGEILRSLGHEVECVDRGEAAVAQYRTAMVQGRPFDIVILDLTIRGGMGGAEAIKELLKIDPHVKAVMSSGYSEDASLSKYHKQGFRAILRKPFTVEDLQSTLNKLLV